MTHSGVSQAVQVVRGRFRERLIRPRVGWRRAAETVWGPLLTLAALIVLDLLARAGTPVLEWFPVLLLTVVISGYLGGLRTALISAVLTVLYGIHFLAEPGMPLRYQPSGAMSLLVVGLIAPGVAVLVSRLHDAARRGRDAELSRAEAEALDRRVSLLSQASTTLASSLDYEVTLRELARALVPTLGDWCTIHAIDERNTPHFIAGAHRDPARDLLVRVLCEYGERRIPFGAPAPGQPIEVTEELLRALAQDDEHRKLYRSLKPSLGSADSAAGSEPARRRAHPGDEPGICAGLRRAGRAPSPVELGERAELRGRRRPRVPPGARGGAAPPPAVRGQSAADVDLRRGDPGVPRGQRRGGPPLRVLARRIPRHDHHGRPPRRRNRPHRRSATRPAVPRPPSPGTSGRTAP